MATFGNIWSPSVSVDRYLLTSASTNANSLDPDRAAHIGTV